MRKRMSVILSVTFVGLVAFLIMSIAHTEASNSKIRSFSGKLGSGETIEVLYVPSTKKLGIVVKNKNGANVSGYVFNGISNPVGEFDLSSAYRKFGKDTLLGTKFVVNKLEKNSTIAGFGQDQVALSPMVIVDKPPFGECHGWCYDVYNWYMCFYCCSTSPDC